MDIRLCFPVVHGIACPLSRYRGLTARAFLQIACGTAHQFSSVGEVRSSAAARHSRFEEYSSLFQVSVVDISGSSLVSRVWSINSTVVHDLTALEGVIWQPGGGGGSCTSACKHWPSALLQPLGCFWSSGKILKTQRHAVETPSIKAKTGARPPDQDANPSFSLPLCTDTAKADDNRH